MQFVPVQKYCTGLLLDRIVFRTQPGNRQLIANLKVQVIITTHRFDHIGHNVYRCKGRIIQTIISVNIFRTYAYGIFSG